MNIKEKLHTLCKAYVAHRLQTVEDIISSNQKALQSETKSSAGDKHETGRAMLQLEMEKAGQQLAGIIAMNETLARIDVVKTAKVAHLGSIISTDTTNYFLCISVGKLTVGATDFYSISISSPIGKLLLGKQVGDEVVFNGKTFKINKVC